MLAYVRDLKNISRRVCFYFGACLYLGLGSLLQFASQACASRMSPREPASLPSRSEPPPPPRAALCPTLIVQGWQSGEDILALPPHEKDTATAKKVFVLKFFGNVQAAQVTAQCTTGRHRARCVVVGCWVTPTCNNGLVLSSHEYRSHGKGNGGDLGYNLPCPRTTTHCLSDGVWHFFGPILCRLRKKFSEFCGNRIWGTQIPSPRPGRAPWATFALHAPPATRPPISCLRQLGSSNCGGAFPPPPSRECPFLCGDFFFKRRGPCQSSVFEITDFPTLRSQPHPVCCINAGCLLHRGTQGRKVGSWGSKVGV